MLNASREDRNRAVVSAVFANSAEIAVVAVCPRGLIRAVNPAFSKRLGHVSPATLVGKSLRDELLVHPADWSNWKRTAATGETCDVRFECRRPDGAAVRFRGAIERIASAQGSDTIVRAILCDDTATHHLRELSMRIAGMEAMSTLTAGVSHDFKNLLTVLVGNLYLISELVGADSPAHEKVKRARDTAKRGADLARQLLDLAVGREAAGEEATGNVTNPCSSVKALVPLLAAALGDKVELRTDLGSDIPSLAVSRTHFESVITNLVINARDSFGPQGGTIVIKVASLHLSGAAGARASLMPGAYVEVSICDDGCGIPENLHEKVFEPLFSTKGPGKGCGLGLPMVRWFAEQAAGTVTLASTPGKGTTVRLLLPAEPAELGDTTVQTMPLSALPSGSETILVLSGNDELRTTIRDILCTLGYRAVPVSPSTLKESMLAYQTAAAIVSDGQSLTRPAVQHLRKWLERRSTATGVVVVGEAPCEISLPGSPIRVSKPFGLAELTGAIRKAVGG